VFYLLSEVENQKISDLKKCWHFFCISCPGSKNLCQCRL